MNKKFVFTLFFLTFAYFYSGTSPNPNTRYDMVRSLVEEHTLMIDSYHLNTIDKANFNGHYYSDKAPGSSILALPVYAITYNIGKLFMGEDIRFSVKAQNMLFHLVQIFTVGLCGAGLMTLIFSFFMKLKREDETHLDEHSPLYQFHHGDYFHILFPTIALGIGTQLFPYSTLLYGHIFAAFSLFAVFYILYFYNKNSKIKFLLIGAITGMGTITEYTVFPGILIILFIYYLFNKNKLQPTNFAKQLIYLGLAGLPFLAILCFINYKVTGNPFTLTYASVEPGFQKAMSKGFYGVTLPSIGVIASLLFGLYRGIFLLSPILLTIFALRAFFDSRKKAYAFTSLAVFIYFLILNAGYTVWWGGASTYPRHLTAAIPFFAIFIYEAFKSRRAYLFALLAFVSIANGFVITTVMPQCFEYLKFPLYALYGAFSQGTIGIALYYGPYMNINGKINHEGTNFGNWLGLTGITSLLPIICMWILFIIYMKKKSQNIVD